MSAVSFGNSTISYYQQKADANYSDEQQQAAKSCYQSMKEDMKDMNQTIADNLTPDDDGSSSSSTSSLADYSASYASMAAGG